MVRVNTSKDHEAKPQVEGNIASFTQPAHGAVTAAAPGQLRYTPNLNFTGVDTFTYTVEDGNGGSSAATVTVFVGLIHDGYWLVASDGGIFAFGDAPLLR